jgi:phage FluMu protein Com
MFVDRVGRHHSPPSLLRIWHRPYPPMNYFSLTSSIRSRGYLFHYFDEVKFKLFTQDRYIDLACPKCKRIDELKAIERIPLQCSQLNKKADLQYPVELLPICSSRYMDFLIYNAPNTFDFYQIEGYQNDKHVMIPKAILTPQIDNFTFKQVGIPCEICNRHYEIMGGPGIPKLNRNGVTCYRQERGLGIDFKLLIDKSLRDSIVSTRPKFKGIDFFRFSPNESHMLPEVR